MTENLAHIHPQLHALAVPIVDLTPDPKNARKHDRRNVDAIKASLSRFGFRQPIVAQRSGDDLIVRAGNGRLQASIELGYEQIPVLVFAEGDDEAVAYAIADNRTAELAEWDLDVLANLLGDLDGEVAQDLGFSQEEIQQLLRPSGSSDGSSPGGESGSVLPSPVPFAERFGLAPFSVLSQRSGWWRDRKAQWLSIGLRSEEGRGGDVDYASNPGASAPRNSGSVFRSPSARDPSFYEQKTAKEAELGVRLTTAEFRDKYYQPLTTTTSLAASGTSVFDPVLCEIAYRWFSARDAVVLDPFAGGSVRGVVASALGRYYHGVDLRDGQISANRAQWEALSSKVPAGPSPTWIAGDSRAVLQTDAVPSHVDLVFSCPPYADLEVYSGLPEDISTMPYDDFMAAYRDIVSHACARLRDNRFAVWVVGDVRYGKHGYYRSFVADTIAAFEDAGLHLYNEAVLVSPIGSLPFRTGRIFPKSRKLGKCHQNVLVFVKGDPSLAAAAAGEVEFGTLGIEGGLEGDLEGGLPEDFDEDQDVPTSDAEDAYIDAPTPVEQVTPGI